MTLTRMLASHAVGGSEIVLVDGEIYGFEAARESG
jgi:hypothetical protein